MISFDVRIVRAIDWAKLTSPGDATLEFFCRFIRNGPFERIGTTAYENGAADAESDREGLQARRILKEVISDK